MFDTDKNSFASKLTIDMLVYIGPTYTMYVGITLFSVTSQICLTLAQRASLCWVNGILQRWPNGVMN